MTVTVSSKYQIVIPPEIRKEFNIRPGERLQVIPYDNRIVFIPMKNIRDMRGFLKCMDTTIERDIDRI